MTIGLVGERVRECRVHWLAQKGYAHQLPAVNRLRRMPVKGTLTPKNTSIERLKLILKHNWILDSISKDTIPHTWRFCQ